MGGEPEYTIIITDPDGNSETIIEPESIEFSAYYDLSESL